MKDWLQRLLIKFVSKASHVVGELRMPWIRKKITGVDYRSVMLFIQAGDVLVSRTNGESGNLFIPGQFSHASMYTGPKNIVESVGTGVRVTDILDFFMNKDIIAVYRPKFASPDEIQACISYCLAQVGKPYNFDFKLSEPEEIGKLKNPNYIEKFYCCELIYKGYNKAVPNMPFTLRKTLGIDTVIPDDFANAKNKFELVWKSESLKGH
jgi:uncharacterized protein YycO